MPDKFVIPNFSSETEEAEWWDSHQDLIAEKFAQAAATGGLGHGRAAQQALRTNSGVLHPRLQFEFPG